MLRWIQGHRVRPFCPAPDLFSVLRRPDWATDVTETLLFEEPYVIVMRPKHPLRVASTG